MPNLLVLILVTSQRLDLYTLQFTASYCTCTCIILKCMYMYMYNFEVHVHVHVHTHNDSDILTYLQCM